MSMQTDVIYGYGVNTHKLNVDEETLKNFLAKHGEGLLNDILARQAAFETSFMTACKEYAADTCSCAEESFWSIVAEIMADETGIDFEYHEGSEYDEEKALMIVEALPWNHSDKTKASTQEDIDRIITEYLNELGIKPESYRIDYVRIEYFG